MAKFITVPENDFSGGIDARAAETSISPAYVKDANNAEIVEKKIRKRKGYSGYAGNIPVRVSEVQYLDTPTADQICFTLNSSVDLSASYSSPILVYGRTSSTITSGGPFINTSDTAKYYTYFTIDTKKTLSTGANTLEVNNTEHDIDTTNLFVQVVESTSTTNRSHRLVLTDAIQADETTYDLDIDYTNGTGAAINAFVYYKDRTAVAGATHIATLSHGGTGSETFNIAAATHALSNYNIIVKVQSDLGSEREFVLPDSVTIDTAGQVSIVLVASAATTFYAILSATDTVNSKSGTVGASSTGTITIPTATSPWIFPAVYLEQSPGGTKEEVLADSIDYDDATKDVTLSFVNGSTSDVNFFVYWEYGTIRSNKICVTDTGVSTTSSLDTRPQLTIWGLDHADLYGTGTLTNREGWTTHIDAYRRSGESRVVCGLGGNLFRAMGYAEDFSSSEDFSDEYLYPKLYPRLQARTGSIPPASAERKLGPAFFVTGSTPARTRGYVTGGNVTSDNKTTITSVTYDASNTWTKYILSFTAMAILDSAAATTAIENVISAAADSLSPNFNLEDYLTVTQMSNSRHEGTFKIKKVTSGSNVVNIWVENSSITATDWDDTGVGGLGTITSDRLIYLANSPFLAADTLTASVLTAASLTITVKSNSTTSCVATGYTAMVTLPGGVVITGNRASTVIPLRAALPSITASITNLVRGDMISFTGISRLLRVKSINPDTDRTVNITANGTAATVTLTSGDTNSLRVGGKVLLLFAGTYTGTQTITEIPSTTTFKFATTSSTTANSATLIGSTAEVDETLSWSDTENDSKSFRVERRWIPIEAPDDSFGLTPSTYLHHLDKKAYNNQDFLRSVTVVDNMYLTNGADEVYKFDGTNLYRAGIIPWQPGLFTTIDENGASEIPADNPSATPSAANVNVFTVTAGNEKKFPIGSRVRHKYQGGYADYNVIDAYYPGTGTDGFVKVQKTGTGDIAIGTSPSLIRLSSVRYYFRLNAIDANNNVIASALTGHQDHVVELASDAAIQIKLIGLPAWDVYDYDRLEVEIYRTKINQVAPYYRIATLAMDFDNTEGYINFTDVLSDVNLIELDAAASTLKGIELGTQWSDPLRAKYVTSLGNRLILGHLTDYPQLDIQLMADGTVTNSTYAGKIFTFRKDNTATGTATTMTGIARYEFINGTTGNATAFSIGTNEFTVTLSGGIAGIAVGDWIYLTYNSTFPTNSITSFTFVDADVEVIPGDDTITETSHGLSNGQQVRFSNTGGALPTGLAASTTYYVVGAATNTFQVSSTLGGAAIAIAAGGGGTHTCSLQGNNLTYSGWWQIESAAASAVTINLTGAAAANAYPNRYVLATDATDIPVLLGTDGNMGMFNGDSLDLFDSMRRMSMAINASMRMVDTGLTGMGTFTPWMAARGGNDVGSAGRLLIRQPRADSLTMEVLLPSSFSGGGKSFTVFVNGVRRLAAAEVSATTRVYPSRILASYENYPEIMDNPTAILDSESDSAIDINSADGQEITGVIPFFGESAFGSAQQGNILVVFKQNSIYLVDLGEKAAGRPAVQRLETEGLGCTAPYSIAPTKNGIVFANESGIYVLRRNQSIQYLGRFIERLWVDGINLSQMSILQGHSYGLGRQYKISVPVSGAISNSRVYVYDHSAEAEGRIGAWTRFDSHLATGWANLAPDAFFASSNGRVLVLRRTGLADDYRDDSTAISFSLETRPNDFGDPGVRKIVGDIIIQYRTGARSTGTAVSTAVDTEQTYRNTTSLIIPVANSGSYVAQDVVSVRHATDRRRGIHIQTKVANSTIDEDVEIAGVSYRVSGLRESGILEATETSTK